MVVDCFLRVSFQSIVEYILRAPAKVNFTPVNKIEAVNESLSESGQIVIEREIN